MKRLQGKLTYANVMSTLCLFLLLGGGAYAATQLPKNSVGTKQIKSQAVTLQKLSKSATQALQGSSGKVGAEGPRGPKGEPGAPSLPGNGKVVSVAGSAEGTASHSSSFNKVAATSNIELPKEAEVLIQGTGEELGTCPPPGSNTCGTAAALFVDGVQASKSHSITLSGGASSIPQLISIPLVDTLEAGTHAVELRIITALQNGGSETMTDASVSAIAVEK
jgi:hypothetical protein